MQRLLPSVGGLTVAALAVIVTFTVPVKVDDVWWHLGAGELMITTHIVPTTNHFSFTAPAEPWLAHEWLAEVLFALAYRAGPSVLVLLATALQVAAFGLVALLARGSGGTPGRSAVLTFVAGLLLLSNWSIRPYLLGNLALLTTLWLAEHPARPLSRWGRLACLAFLFALWANLHGSFVFGLGGLVLWAVTERARWRWVELGVATLACLATPHHVHGLLLPLRYVRASLQPTGSFLANLMEWQRVSPTSPLGIGLLACLAGAVAVMAASRLRPRVAHLALLLGCTLAAFSAVRNVALVGFALAVVLPRHLEALSSQRTPLPLPGSPLLPMGAWALAAVTTLGAPLSDAFFPRAAIASLRPGERVFNSFNWEAR
jgi:hypothetical protein